MSKGIRAQLQFDQDRNAFVFRLKNTGQEEVVLRKPEAWLDCIVVGRKGHPNLSERGQICIVSPGRSFALMPGEDAGFEIEPFLSYRLPEPGIYVIWVYYEAAVEFGVCWDSWYTKIRHQRLPDAIVSCSNALWVAVSEARSLSVLEPPRDLDIVLSFDRQRGILVGWLRNVAGRDLLLRAPDMQTDLVVVSKAGQHHAAVTEKRPGIEAHTLHLPAGETFDFEMPLMEQFTFRIAGIFQAWLAYDVLDPAIKLDRQPPLDQLSATSNVVAIDVLEDAVTPFDGTFVTEEDQGLALAARMRLELAQVHRKERWWEFWKW